jgi:hypothetical protein
MRSPRRASGSARAWSTSSPQLAMSRMRNGEREVALQAQRSTSYALTGLLEAETGRDVLVPPVGPSLGDGSDVAHFGGEVVLATSSTHDDSERVGVLGSVERVGSQLANFTDGYVLPAAWNAVEAGAVPGHGYPLGLRDGVGPVDAAWRLRGAARRPGPRSQPDHRARRRGTRLDVRATTADRHRRRPRTGQALGARSAQSRRTAGRHRPSHPAVRGAGAGRHHGPVEGRAPSPARAPGPVSRGDHRAARASAGRPRRLHGSRAALVAESGQPALLATPCRRGASIRPAPQCRRHLAMAGDPRAQRRARRAGAQHHGRADGERP